MKRYKKIYKSIFAAALAAAVFTLPMTAAADEADRQMERTDGRTSYVTILMGASTAATLESYEYYENGALASVTADYMVDGYLNRSGVTRYNEPDPATGSCHGTYTSYDAEGNQDTDFVSHYYLTYDENMRITSKSETDAEGDVTWYTTAYFYDQAGNLISTVQDDAFCVVTTNYTYDQYNVLTDKEEIFQYEDDPESCFTYTCHYDYDYYNGLPATCYEYMDGELYSVSLIYRDMKGLKMIESKINYLYHDTEVTDFEYAEPFTYYGMGVWEDTAPMNAEELPDPDAAKDSQDDWADFVGEIPSITFNRDSESFDFDGHTYISNGVHCYVCTDPDNYGDSYRIEYGGMKPDIYVDNIPMIHVPLSFIFGPDEFDLGW